MAATQAQDSFLKDPATTQIFKDEPKDSEGEIPPYLGIIDDYISSLTLPDIQKSQEDDVPEPIAWSRRCGSRDWTSSRSSMYLYAMICVLLVSKICHSRIYLSNAR